MATQMHVDDVPLKMLETDRGTMTQAVGIVTRDEVAPRRVNDDGTLQIDRHGRIENNSALIGKHATARGSYSALGIALQGERDDLHGEHVRDSDAVQALALTDAQAAYLEWCGVDLSYR
jgi:hypothetical protein